MAGFNNQQRLQQKLIGANEDMFLQAFDSTPKLNISTQKKLEHELARVIATISNPNAEWDQRMQAMKHFRSLYESGIGNSEDFYTTTLKSLEVPFQNNICDLRSQVVRETCITIAFLSSRLEHKFARMAEILLPSLIKLIPNSAKIISTSSLVALRFIIQSTPHSKLITIIKYQLSTSKSKEIHKALCEIAERIITLWPPNVIERHINDFSEVLRLGICDSDEQARQTARRAFNVFAEHFREHADRLYNSLDPQRQRMLNNLNHGGGSTLSINGGLNTIGISNNHHHNQYQHHHQVHHHHHQQLPQSQQHVQQYHQQQQLNQQHQQPPSQIQQPQLHHQTLQQAPQTPQSNNNSVSRLKTSIVSSSPSRIRTPTARSTSAIDVDAQKRARARAVYLSSMYQRPRQLGGYMGGLDAAKVCITPSPAKSNLPQPITPVDSGQKKPAASPAGLVLSKASAYLMSVINDRSIAESQIVTTIKYFNSQIEQHPPEIINQLLPELMAPLVIGIGNEAICVRKASVFAMVAIYAKVGMQQIETYLTKLTMTQRKLLEVYIRKSKQEL